MNVVYLILVYVRLVHLNVVYLKLVHMKLAHMKLVHLKLVHLILVHLNLVHSNVVHLNLVHLKLVYLNLVQLPHGEYHRIHTIGSKPSCYMFVYENTTDKAEFKKERAMSKKFEMMVNASKEQPGEGCRN